MRRVAESGPTWLKKQRLVLTVGNGKAMKRIVVCAASLSLALPAAAAPATLPSALLEYLRQRGLH